MADSDATRAPSRQLSRWRRLVRSWLLPLLAITLGARIAAPVLLRRAIEHLIERAGCSGEIGLVDLSVTQRRLQVTDLRIRSPADAAGGRPRLSLDVPTIDIEWSPWALVHGRFEGDVVLDRPHLDLRTRGADDGGGDHPLWREGLRVALPLTIHHLDVRDGDVQWRRSSPPAALRFLRVDVRVDELDDRSGAASAIAIRARTTGGGDLAADGAVDPFAPAPSGELAVILRGVAIEELQPLWNPKRITVRSGRLDAFASLRLEQGRLRGWIRPIARDLDVEEVRREAEHRDLGGLHDIIADLSSDVIDRHGPLTAEVPIDVAMDRAGAAAQLTRSLRDALAEELRAPPARPWTARLGAFGGLNRSVGVALDALNADGVGWRFGAGVEARRQRDHRGAFAEAVAGAGTWLGLVRIDALPFVGVGATSDEQGNGGQVAIGYGARLDATIPIGRAALGARIAWEAARDLRDARTWSAPVVGLVLGMRF